MARIRSDLVGQLMGHRTDNYDRAVRARPVYLSAGDTVPAGVKVSSRYLEPEDGGGPAGGSGTTPAGPPFDPDVLTVDEVNARLDGVSDAEAAAVLAAEAAGRNRAGIVNGPHRVTAG
jgi:hypothetical protein